VWLPALTGVACAQSSGAGRAPAAAAADDDDDDDVPDLVENFEEIS